MKKGIWYALILIVSMKLFSCGEGTANAPANDRYESPWKSPENELIPIGKALVKSKVTGCGELYIRKSKTSDNEYLVACTRDTKSWRYYVVKTDEGTAEGPLTDSIPSPY